MAQQALESDPPRPRGTYKYEWLESTWTGCKHVLGVWLGEGAKYWLSAFDRDTQPRPEKTR